MGPGDFFGEGGVVSAQPRGESVRAVTPVKVMNARNASFVYERGGEGGFFFFLGFGIWNQGEGYCQGE